MPGNMSGTFHSTPSDVYGLYVQEGQMWAGKQGHHLPGATQQVKRQRWEFLHTPSTTDWQKRKMQSEGRAVSVVAHF